MSEPPKSLARLLDRERKARFVGREEEVALVLECLDERPLPFQVLYVFGPAGIGKSSLLSRWASAASERGVRWLELDARHVAADRGEVDRALEVALVPAHASTGSDPAPAPRCILAVDGFEAWAALESWLCRDRLARLPASCLVVLASRRHPSTAWTDGGGWHGLFRPLRLAELAPLEARACLSARGVPPREALAIAGKGGGHPLALTLLADAWCARGVSGGLPDDFAPSVVPTVVSRILEEVDTPERRAALEVVAVFRRAHEHLLTEMLGDAAASDHFDWLRRLSLVELGPRGVSLNEPLRGMLLAELRWRNPVRYAALVRRARRYLEGRLGEARGASLDLLSAYLSLPRDDDRPSDSAWPPPPDGASLRQFSGSDRDALVAMTERNEGPRAAASLTHWLDEAPDAVRVARDDAGDVVGYILCLPLDHPAARAADDPLVQAAHFDLQASALLRSGERAVLLRAWMARDDHQEPSSIGTLLLLAPLLARPPLERPALTYFAGAAGVTSLLSRAGADLVGAQEVDGATLSLHRLDWRRSPLLSWLDALSDFEPVAPLSGPPSSRSTGAVASVLGREDFAAAVRDALRDLAADRALGESPLLRSRLVSDRVPSSASPSERIAALRALVLEAAAELAASPRHAKHHRALLRTYLEPAPTQDKAAELLKLPFSTYRRHLRAAVAYVVEALWQLELDGGSLRSG